jgi:23S rRNA pseudouridine2605 synthase
MRFLSSGYSPLRMERIDKILASRGVKSRNEASKLLQQGRVQVNGRVVRGRGDKFLSDAKIRISSVELPPLPVLVGYHKPLGVLSSIGDPWNRPNLSQVIDDHKDLLGQMHPVVIKYSWLLCSLRFVHDYTIY